MSLFQEVVERLFLTDISERSLVSVQTSPAHFSNSHLSLKEFLRLMVLQTSSDLSVSI